jgi:anti-sigma regulatory factor (Ser/Thr protein kinase)
MNSEDSSAGRPSPLHGPVQRMSVPQRPMRVGAVHATGWAGRPTGSPHDKPGRASRPGGGSLATRLLLTAEPASAGRARDFTHKQLVSWGLNPLIDNAVAIVSELFTNAITHGFATDASTPAARRRTAHPRLILIRHPHRLQIVMTDPSRTPPALIDATKTTLFATSGRGLHLVGALSRRWGWALLPTGGKAVWAILDDPNPQ